MILVKYFIFKPFWQGEGVKGRGMATLSQSVPVKDIPRMWDFRLVFDVPLACST